MTMRFVQAMIPFARLGGRQWPWASLWMLQGAILCALVIFASDAHAITPIGASSVQVNGDAIGVATPADVEAGHVMVAQIAFRGGDDVAIAPPVGWALIRRNNQVNILGQAIYYRVVTASEPVTHTWALSSGQRAVGIISAYANVDADNPVSVHAGQAAANGTSIIAPSLTTSIANTLLVGMFSAADGNTTPSPPGGMSDPQVVTTGAGPNGVSVVLANEAFISPGSTGNRTATGADVANIGQLVALRPAVAGVPVQVRFSQQPTNAEVNGILPAVTARIEDARGIVVGESTASVTLTLLSNPGGATLKGMTTVAAENGVATFSDLSLDQNGDGYTLEATADLLASDVSTAFNISPILRGFNAFETDTMIGAVNGWIRTKVAGSGFDLDLVAIDPSSGSIDAGFKHRVSVQLLDASDNSGTLDLNTGCRNSWTPIPDQLHTGIRFDGQIEGRRRITFQEDAIWPQVRVRVESETGAKRIGCSNDTFAIRPDAFINVNVSDADWENAGTSRMLVNTSADGGVVHKAGAPFSIAATAVDASDKPMTGYVGTPVVAVNCTLPEDGNCVDGLVDPGAWSVSDANLMTDTAVYSEAGVFFLSLEDHDFAAVDNGDGSTEAERYIRSTPKEIGRFVPDRFVLLVETEPMFLTFNNAACTGRSFTYLGQPFGWAIEPVARIEAVNVAGAVTQNYSHELWKLTGADVEQLYGAATDPDGHSLDTSEISFPVVMAAGDGTGTARSAPGDLLVFDRGAVGATDDPPEPFTAELTLSMDLTDRSESGEVGNGAITTDAPLVFDDHGNGGIVFDAGNKFRYGRLRLVNAIGPENRDLKVPVRVETWQPVSGGVFAWVTEENDSCTNVLVNDFSLDAPDFASVNTFTGFSAGKGGLTLGASNVTGTVKVTAGLENAGMQWLRFDWNGDGADSDPAGRASFGFYEGNPRRVYQREQF